MTVRELSKIMSDNGIPYKRDFVNVENEGCIAEYRDVFTDIKGDIEEYVRYGVQNGFTPAIKDNIERLARMMVDICGEKKPKHVKKYVDKRDEIKRRSKEVMGNSVGLDARNEVVKYVNDAINAAEALKSRKMSEARRKILDRCIEGLRDVAKKLNDVTDVATKTALDFSNNVLGELFNWWKNDAEALMLTENSVKKIEGISSTVDKWKVSHTGIERGFLGKAKNGISTEEFGGIAYKRGRMAYIAQSYECIEKVDIICEKILERKNTIKEKNEALAQDKKKVDEIDSQIKALNDEKIQIAKNFANGLDPRPKTVVNAEVVKINNDISRLEGRKAQLNQTFKNRQTLIYNEEVVIGKVELIVEKLVDQKEKLITFAIIVESIDFTSIDNVLIGSPTQTDVNNVANLAANIEKRIIATIEANKELISQLGEIEAETISEMEEYDTIVNAPIGQEQVTENTDALDGLLSGLGAQPSGSVTNNNPVENPVTPNQEEILDQAFGDFSNK